MKCAYLGLSDVLVMSCAIDNDFGPDIRIIATLALPLELASAQIVSDVDTLYALIRWRIFL